MNYPDMKEALREQAKDDYIKFGCPTLGVQHGREPVPRRAITVESTLLAPELYECNFCHCLTNAKQRICCEAGKLADATNLDCDDRDHGDLPKVRTTWTCPCGWTGENPGRKQNGFGCTVNRFCPACGGGLYGKQEIEL